MKVIVADDEKWVRATIIGTVPFNQLGLTLVCEASNGLEALELCKQHQPDILLTDINMPGLTGLELIEELKKVLPEIKIVIISGYSDFEYAKNAIKFGVSDYVLKPVDETEITKILSQIKESILSQKKHLEEENTLKTQNKQALSILCEKFLNQLIAQNSLTADTIKNNLSSYGMSFSHPYFTTAIFSIDYTSIPDKTKASGNLKRLLVWIMKRYLNAATFSKLSTDNELVSIINHTHSRGHESLSKALKLCIAFFQRKYNNSLTIGISSTGQQLNRLPILYTQAHEALSWGFWSCGERVFYYQQDNTTSNVNIQPSEESLNYIIPNIKLSNCQPAYSYIDEICSDLRTYNHIKPSLAKEFFWTFIQLIISRLDIQISFIEYETLLINEHPYERITKISSIKSLSIYTKEMIQHICDHYHDKHLEDTNIGVVEVAKKIIEENYYKDISLEQIAKYVHLNPTYFSELFKKETGIGFIEYKTLLRIENAKKLLASTSMNTNEISNKIGYSDPKYFIKLFKKITGMTLGEYREKSSKENSK
ncbi:MAG: response regulator [Clostridia bacterium]|nr:response regulator [Clostridia bacterium]